MRVAKKGFRNAASRPRGSVSRELQRRTKTGSEGWLRGSLQQMQVMPKKESLQSVQVTARGRRKRRKSSVMQGWRLRHVAVSWCLQKVCAAERE